MHSGRAKAACHGDMPEPACNVPPPSPPSSCIETPPVCAHRGACARTVEPAGGHLYVHRYQPQRQPPARANAQPIARELDARLARRVAAAVVPAGLFADPIRHPADRSVPLSVNRWISAPSWVPCSVRRSSDRPAVSSTSTSTGPATGYWRAQSAELGLVRRRVRFPPEEPVIIAPTRACLRRCRVRRPAWFACPPARPARPGRRTN